MYSINRVLWLIFFVALHTCTVLIVACLASLHPPCWRVSLLILNVLFPFRTSFSIHTPFLFSFLLVTISLRFFSSDLYFRTRLVLVLGGTRGGIGFSCTSLETCVPVRAWHIRTLTSDFFFLFFGGCKTCFSYDTRVYHFWFVLLSPGMFLHSRLTGSLSCDHILDHAR